MTGLDPRAVASVLLIRFSALGDVVLATSVLPALRALLPRARVEWLVDEGHAPLLEGQVDALVTFRRGEPASRAAALAAVRGRFSLAVDLQNKLWSRQVAAAAAPRTLRLVKRSPGQALRALLGRGPVLDGPHATALYASVLAPLGPAAPGTPVLHLPAAAKARARALLPGEGWTGLVPGAAWATKRWPPERFGELARALHAQGRRPVLLGGPMDAPQLEVVRTVAGPALQADLCQEPLPVVAAAAARCRVVVGADSGLLQVAGALQVPAVVLFGPTSVRRWGPRPPGVALSLGLPCAPCSNHGGARCPLGHQECLKALPVEQVLAAALERGG